MDPRKSGGGSASRAALFFDAQNYAADLSHITYFAMFASGPAWGDELRVYRLAKRSVGRLRVRAAEGQV